MLQNNLFLVFIQNAHVEEGFLGIRMVDENIVKLKIYQNFIKNLGIFLDILSLPN